MQRNTLDLKAPFEFANFTGTVSESTTMVGLGSVDNTSDATNQFQLLLKLL
jgi:hypothetical protein